VTLPERVVVAVFDPSWQIVKSVLRRVATLVRRRPLWVVAVRRRDSDGQWTSFGHTRSFAQARSWRLGFLMDPLWRDLEIEVVTKDVIVEWNSAATWPGL
jgi:hypothetical protein